MSSPTSEPIPVPEPTSPEPYEGIFDPAEAALNEGVHASLPVSAASLSTEHSRAREWAENTIGRKSLGHRALSSVIDSGPLGVPVDIVRSFRGKDARLSREADAQATADRIAANNLSADIAYQKGLHDSRIVHDAEMTARERAAEDRIRSRQAEVDARQRESSPLNETEKALFEPQALLDLDDAMREAINDAVHTHKDRLGIDKVDPADLPRLRAAARRRVMQGYLGAAYSDDLSGRLEAARLIAVKKFKDGGSRGPSSQRPH